MALQRHWVGWFLVVTLGWSGGASAIPAFARRYSASCAMCHDPAPRLNDLGNLFANNGFQLALKEPPRDAIETGDPLLQLLDDIGLALRLDTFVAAETGVQTPDPSVDLQVPWTVKVLSGGPIAPNLSYYLYFLLAERGEVAGLEDAYLQFSDVFGSGVHLLAGQFQVSDPMFKRELRLPYEDFHSYRVRAGFARADLTYDRGLMANWSPPWWKGGALSLMLVSGQGLSGASEARQFDTDLWKNVGARYAQDVGPLTLGAFGYLGWESAEGALDRILVFGPDVTLGLGKLEANVQWLRRLDTNPLLVAGGAASRIDTILAQLVYGPFWGDRFYAAGVYNWISADAPVLSLRLGESDTTLGFLERYHTAAFGLHYLLRRNVRVMGEARWDFENDRLRLVTGLSMAF